ncbi:related to nitrogen metabolic regulation protein nmr [Phialocephala subalpina]|uniref:Related to nitrogen metabolic regulation protein nmr n=1 Tax=Phialocephala subalpina TaxID=576137 RepID=A0A1L7XQD6_9HELO|nr:related to nitrogen metabolic regulation protein nmr [Phialocephala subalpina]
MSSPKPTVLILGGAGAQNSAVAKVLSKAGTYTINVLTRSLTTPYAVELALLPNVHLLEGDCYDEDTLISAFQGVDFCFVNTNGFAIGEKSEIYWGIRMYELARGAGVKHFVYGGLPYVSANGGFDPKSRVPFVDGKGKFGQYLQSMPTKPMAWTILSSGPYAERLYEPQNVPQPDENGIYVFRLPLGPTGAMPLVSLDDLGEYAKWMFENPSRSAGLNLGVSIAHVTGAEHAEAFEAVTGKKARYEDIDLDEHLDGLPKGKIGGKGSPGFDDPTLRTAKEHFGPWWGIFRESGGNKGLWSRDYGLLDEIMPNRIKTLEEWMRKVKYDGTAKRVLKTGLN